MTNSQHVEKPAALSDSGQSACEGVPEEKLVAIAVAVLLGTAGVALVLMVWE
jgi:hypothetical protein